jgi:hypothetical protein
MTESGKNSSGAVAPFSDAAGAVLADFIGRMTVADDGSAIAISDLAIRLAHWQGAARTPHDAPRLVSLLGSLGYKLAYVKGGGDPTRTAVMLSLTGRAWSPEAIAAATPGVPS